MQIVQRFNTTAARLAFVAQSADQGQLVQDLQDGEIYLILQTGSGAGIYRSISDISQLATLDTRVGVLEVSPTARGWGIGSDPFFIAPLTLVENTAYWMYVGYFPFARTINRIRFQVTTGGTGAQTAEVALASSPAAPNRANQVLTKIVHDAALDDLTGTGLMSNGNDLGQVIAAGTHLWAGIRTAMATNEPAINASGSDWGQGRILSTAASGALSGAGPWTGAVIAHAVAAQCPILHVTMD